jgi:hypothetical protein
LRPGAGARYEKLLDAEQAHQVQPFTSPWVCVGADQQLLALVGGDQGSQSVSWRPTRGWIRILRLERRTATSCSAQSRRKSELPTSSRSMSPRPWDRRPGGQRLHARSALSSLGKQLDDPVSVTDLDRHVQARLCATRPSGLGRSLVASATVDGVVRCTGRGVICSPGLEHPLCVSSSINASPCRSLLERDTNRVRSTRIPWCSVRTSYCTPINPGSGRPCVGSFRGTLLTKSMARLSMRPVSNCWAYPSNKA